MGKIDIWVAVLLLYLSYIYTFLKMRLEHGHRWDSRRCDFSTGFEMVICGATVV